MGKYWASLDPSVRCNIISRNVSFTIFWNKDKMIIINAPVRLYKRINTLNIILYPILLVILRH